MVCPYCNGYALGNGCPNWFCDGGIIRDAGHKCEFTKEVHLLRKVIGICDCGKEKELAWDEIGKNKKAKKNV